MKSEKKTKSKLGINDKLSGLGKPIDGFFPQHVYPNRADSLTFS